MKRTTKKLTKMQRKARSHRKTWTNAERFEMRNAKAMKEAVQLQRAMKKFREQVLAQSAPAQEEVADGTVVAEETQ